MSVRNEALRDFHQLGFAEAFDQLDSNIDDWRSRRAIPYLDRALEYVDAQIKEDPNVARAQAERLLPLVEGAAASGLGRKRRGERHWRGTASMTWADLLVMAKGVMAATWTWTGRARRAARYLRSFDLDTIDAGVCSSIQWRHAVASMFNNNWQEALSLADQAVATAKLADFTVCSETPYRSSPPCYSVRSFVVGELVDRGELDLYRLSDVVADGSRTFELARAARFREMEVMGLSAVARAVATAGYSGQDMAVKSAGLLEALRRADVPRTSANWATIRWTEALCDCALHQALTAEAERAYDEARTHKWDRAVKRPDGAVTHLDDVVRITVDLQWWLIASGEPFKADYESEWIRAALEHGASFDRSTLELWMVEIHARKLSAEVAEMVFREVRGLSRVPGVLPP